MQAGFSLSWQPGHATEADALADEALNDARVVWGERNQDYLRLLNSFAVIKMNERDFGKAAEICRRLLSLQDQEGCSLHAQINLGFCLYNLERLDELEVALNRLDADVRRFVGENSVAFGNTNVLGGMLNFARGENRAAIPHLQRGLGPLSAAFVPDAFAVVQCQACLGLCLTRDHCAAEGEQFLRAAYEHGGKIDRADFAHTIGNLETALGECLLAQKRYSEAEPLLLTGQADLQKRLGAQNRLTIQATHRLYDLYLAWNKPAEAGRFAGDATAQPTLTP